MSKAQAVLSDCGAVAAVNGSGWALQPPIRPCAGGCGTVIGCGRGRRYCSDRCRLLAWAKRDALVEAALRGLLSYVGQLELLAYQIEEVDVPHATVANARAALRDTAKEGKP